MPQFINDKLNSPQCIYFLTIISHKISLHDNLMPEKCRVLIFSGDEYNEHPAGTICVFLSLRLLVNWYLRKF